MTFTSRGAGAAAAAVTTALGLCLGATTANAETTSGSSYWMPDIPERLGSGSGSGSSAGSSALWSDTTNAGSALFGLTPMRHPESGQWRAAGTPAVRPVADTGSAGYYTGSSDLGMLLLSPLCWLTGTGSPGDMTPGPGYICTATGSAAPLRSGV
ncbi:hypothetical protein ACWEVD_24495 [Nocardia thailandica]